MADATAAWQEFFGHWPDEMSRQGILVTSFGEQIPFANFLCKPSLLLLERRGRKSTSHLRDIALRKFAAMP